MANPSAKSHIEATGPPSFLCELATWNVTRLSLTELAALRKEPATRLPPHITAQFLKNSDDQTLASLIAIYSGIEALGKEREAYRDWGIVSASQYIGRGSFAATLHKYCKDGPWGVSVQVIPHNMLHSISSTISLTLPCVGPCLGAGGGIQGEMDALLIAVNLLSGGQIPGVWVTWSVWDPELIIDEAGKPKSESSCIAVALALIPITAQEPRAQFELRLRESRFDPTLEPGKAAGQVLNSAAMSLTSILRHVTEIKPQSLQIVCPLKGGLELSLQWRPSHDEVETNINRIPETLWQETEASA